MAINVNEEGVMKPLTIDGTPISGFTINGIELLFDGTLKQAASSEKYYKMQRLELPRSPQDYKFFIIIAVSKAIVNGQAPLFADTIAIIDLERFFDGAGQTETGGTIGYNHTYSVKCGIETVCLKDDPNHTTLYIAHTEANTSMRYYHKIFGVY